MAYVLFAFLGSYGILIRKEVVIMQIINCFFTGSGQTKTICDYFQSQFETSKIIDLSDPRLSLVQTDCDLLIISLPVYSQNTPRPVRKLINDLHAKYVIINLTYGQISPGNVLKELANHFVNKGSTVIAGALIPAKHTYLSDQIAIDFQKLDLICEKVRRGDYSSVVIHPRFKHPLASIGEGMRTRYNVKITWDAKHCIYCYDCVNNCPVGALTIPLSITQKCLRCTKCVVTCQTQALEFKPRRLLLKYLKSKHKTTQAVVFL